MKVCLVKLTNKLVEMQSHATPGTLISNALNAGYSENEIEEREVTETEYAELMKDPYEKEKKEIISLRNFLSSTDYKIIRQIEQNTMSETEYQQLLLDRQNARNRINELEVILSVS